MYLDDTIIARFWSRASKTDCCWLYQGRLDASGYGVFRARLNGPTSRVVNKPAHRVAYTIAYGDIPADLVIDHVWARGCRNRHCVNPAHLEAVTVKENNRRSFNFAGLNARKTHCKYGHPLSGDNLRVNGHQRICVTCDKAQRKHYQRDAYRREQEARMAPEPPRPGEPLTMAEAARQLGVSGRTVQRYLRAGKLDGYKVHTVNGHEWRIRLTEEQIAAKLSPAPDTTTTALVTLDESPKTVTTATDLTLAMDRADTRAIDVPDPEVHRALAAALRDALAANQAWAHRYDTLAAEVASLRRPWWRRVWYTWRNK